MLYKSNKSELVFGLGFRQAVCPIALFPATILLEYINALKALHDVASSADFGRAFQTAVHGHESISVVVLKNEGGT